MSTKKQLFTVSVYTENNIGLLNRISAIFQRRHINIESLNTSPSEIKGVSRFTIVVYVSEVNMKKRDEFVILDHKGTEEDSF